MTRLASTDTSSTSTSIAASTEQGRLLGEGHGDVNVVVENGLSIKTTNKKLMTLLFTLIGALILITWSTIGLASHPDLASNPGLEPGSQEEKLARAELGDHEEKVLFDSLLDQHNGENFEYKYACDADSLAKLKKGTYEYEIRAADCGIGFDFKNSPKRNNTYKIALYGDSWKRYIHLSGCSNGGGHLPCPWRPQCVFQMTSRPGKLKDADVVVVTTKDRALIHDAPRTKPDGSPGPHRVLYWREAFWTGVAAKNQLHDFEFEMGIHTRSGLLNPNYIRRPHTLLSKTLFPFTPFSERPNFALSIISDCHASSQDKHMWTTFRITLAHTASITFENTIYGGYTTESSLPCQTWAALSQYILELPIFQTLHEFPLFNVMNFGTPKDLATSLLWMEKHAEEFDKYNVWRTKPELFDVNYLRIVQRQMPGQDEMQPYNYRDFDHFPRRAACCRLCDEDFVKKSTVLRTERDLVHSKWTPDKISHRLFAGIINKLPGKRAQLEP